MSYEEEDTCHMRRRIHVIRYLVTNTIFGDKEDTSVLLHW
jgi:hypothetical protein